MTDSLLGRVAQRAKDQPDGVAFVFMQRHDEPGERLSWSELWKLAGMVAKGIDLQSEPNKTGVLIFCTDEKNFVISLLAVWMRGAVAIPAIANLQKGVVARNQHIIEQAKPDTVLHDLINEKTTAISDLAPQARLVSVAEILDNSQGSHDANAEMTASCHNVGHLLQFTSGSTAKPKPIYLDGSKVAASCRAIEEAYSLSEKSVGVHWLPLFHDMGLIGSCISSMWSGCLSVLLRPTVFIQRPLVWLQQISHWRGTITSAPNFAYERLCYALKTDDLNNIDLTSLDNLIIGGEPVAQATITKLLATLGPCGLRPSALAPSYGMAEATLLISTGKRATGPIYSDTHSETPSVGLGAAVNCVQLSVCDATTGDELPDRNLGEIWIRGKSVGQVVLPGQDWRRYQSAQHAVASTSDEPKAGINTGDFGYIENGSLFITGRDSNKLIIRGRNIFAEDVEQIVTKSQTPNFCAAVAAVGIDDHGSQSLAILIEKNKIDAEFNISALNKAIVSKLGIKPHSVVVLKRASLPRTSSGKIQRNLARIAFVAGHYHHRVLHDVIQAGN